ncbi:MAG: hypothetical protein SAJ72_16425 [Jaaginema sp. PMC 1080.18]|nr:hypothetical protein [Jaaginema sp. PMC 1080.18]MEC4864898.1 hypothetical protein [Jaaginema sp. PMC 1078.18]
MTKFLYTQSLSHRGYLIIPFEFAKFDQEMVYSYILLSDKGYKGSFHKAKNPAQLYSSNLEEIIAIAQTHLDEKTEESHDIDYFRQRYVYRENLLILHEEAGKCFYDHYPPNELRNIAAPKLFYTARECLSWVKRGLDRNVLSKPMQS